MHNRKRWFAVLAVGILSLALGASSLVHARQGQRPGSAAWGSRSRLGDDCGEIGARIMERVGLGSPAISDAEWAVPAAARPICGLGRWLGDDPESTMAKIAEGLESGMSPSEILESLGLPPTCAALSRWPGLWLGDDPDNTWAKVAEKMESGMTLQEALLDLGIELPIETGGPMGAGFPMKGNHARGFGPLGARLDGIRARISAIGDDETRARAEDGLEQVDSLWREVKEKLEAAENALRELDAAVPRARLPQGE